MVLYIFCFSSPSEEGPFWRAGEPCRGQRRFRCRGSRSDKSRRTPLWRKGGRTARGRGNPGTGRTGPVPTTSNSCPRPRRQPRRKRRLRRAPSACLGKRRPAAAPPPPSPSSSCSGPSGCRSLKLRERLLREIEIFESTNGRKGKSHFKYSSAREIIRIRVIIFVSSPDNVKRRTISQFTVGNKAASPPHYSNYLSQLPTLSLTKRASIHPVYSITQLNKSFPRVTNLANNSVNPGNFISS